MERDEIARVVAGLVGRLIADIAADPKLRAIAKELQALPLVNEAVGSYLLRPDGEIVFAEWGAKESAAPETSERIRNLVLAEGSRKYAELTAMSPVRPSDAPDCPYCRGTGIPSGAEPLGPTEVGCYCGGLGWIPATDPSAPPLG